jgi:hypothetical protein
MTPLLFKGTKGARIKESTIEAEPHDLPLKQRQTGEEEKKSRRLPGVDGDFKYPEGTKQESGRIENESLMYNKGNFDFNTEYAELSGSRMKEKLIERGMIAKRVG